ncbi:MAG: GNAT family N-acetyltransferase [Crocinitomicaceae bacterium]
MKTIINPVSKSVLKAELTSEKFVRKTRKGDNEIYIVNQHNAPNTLREIGRLREITFRASGGGTGEELDLDEYDLREICYQQLIVWSPEDEEIIGGYRYIKCKDAIDSTEEIHLSTAHYFKFSSDFIDNYLSKTIELGRSWVQPDYQPTVNPKKGLYALDNIWDGLGALVKFNPEIRYFFGKVTMYPAYNRPSRNFLLTFMHTFFPDKEKLMTPYNPLILDEDCSLYIQMIKDLPYKEAFKELNTFVREHGEFVPPLVNIYMSLSPSMKTFGTAVNPEFGNVEETGILVTIDDIYEEKKERYLNF